ncbi:MAG: pantoate--beta-alanine ligase [Firmicutes bacterium]|nr:pantoate--beta-alanine ligase [Bacillota bacterium]
MQVINNIKKMKSLLKEVKKTGKTVGLVPTMGYLHKGHLSLIKKARKDNNIVVVSIFVNPTQFGEGEDLDKYPRDLERDINLIKEMTDYVFTPSDKDMYPEGFNTTVEVKEITDKLCGKSRPGHFRGVSTVVLKLFNIVRPNRAYFGLKDAQQVFVIKRMVKDLNLSIEIIPCPIIRDTDGLAISSRNVYLTSSERKEALSISKSLNFAKSKIEKGERNINKIKSKIIKDITANPSAKIDYVEILDINTFKEVKNIDGKIIIAVAVFIGKARLLDNIILEVKK